MTTRTRMNVYFAPELLAQVEALALRRQVEIGHHRGGRPSFLSGDASIGWRRPCRAVSTRSGARIRALDEDLAVLGETVSLFVNIWLASTPTLPRAPGCRPRKRSGEVRGIHADARQRLATSNAS